jgi:hypothetical protein
VGRGLVREQAIARCILPSRSVAASALRLGSRRTGPLLVEAPAKPLEDKLHGFDLGPIEELAGIVALVE